LAESVAPTEIYRIHERYASGGGTLDSRPRRVRLGRGMHDFNGAVVPCTQIHLSLTLAHVGETISRFVHAGHVNGAPSIKAEGPDAGVGGAGGGFSVHGIPGGLGGGTGRPGEGGPSGAGGGLAPSAAGGHDERGNPDGGSSTRALIYEGSYKCNDDLGPGTGAAVSHPKISNFEM
jgi:hypothetical protein